MDDQWFDQPVLGALPPAVAAEKLAELGETELADQLLAMPPESGYRHSSRSRWPFRTKAWQHTSHAFGFVAPMASDGARDILDVAEIEAEPALRNARIKVTLDALRIEEYPGSGTHHILLDFYAQNQIRPAPEHLHFNATYTVRQGERAAIRGYPIFLGLAAGEEGVAFRCFTVNVKNERDQALLAFLDSDALKAGLRLATVAQPAIAPLASLAQNLTKSLAGRRQNVPVQDVYVGLDFGDTATGARLRQGSYIVVQHPSDGDAFRWSEWMLDTSSRMVLRKDDRHVALPYNYFIFAVTRFAG